MPIRFYIFIFFRESFHMSSLAKLGEVSGKQMPQEES